MSMYVYISCNIPVFNQKRCILHRAGYNNKFNIKKRSHVRLRNASLLTSHFSSGLIFLLESLQMLENELTEHFSYIENTSHHRSRTGVEEPRGVWARTPTFKFRILLK